MYLDLYPRHKAIELTRQAEQHRLANLTRGSHTAQRIERPAARVVTQLVSAFRRSPAAPQAPAPVLPQAPTCCPA